MLVPRTPVVRGDFFEGSVNLDPSGALEFVMVRFVCRVHYRSGSVYDWCYFVTAPIIQPWESYTLAVLEIILSRIWRLAHLGLFARHVDDLKPKCVRRVELLPWAEPPGGFNFAPVGSGA